MKAFAILCASVCLLSGAPAAADPSYDGAWRASFKRVDGTGRTFDAVLNLSGDSGTWKVFNVQSYRSNTCLGMVAPVRDVEASDSGLSFQVKGSEATAGCHDPKVRLSKTEAPNTLKGTLGRDYLLEITRD